MQLLLMEDQHVVQALSSHTAQKAFTDRISSWRMIGRFKYLDTARCCHMSETRPKLALVITDEILRRLSIQSRLPQLLLRPAERAATGRFTLVKHRGNLSKLVREDFVQEEDRSLKRLELLQQHQECQRDRLLHVDTLLRVVRFGSLRSEDRLR